MTTRPRYSSITIIIIIIIIIITDLYTERNGLPKETFRHLINN